MTIEKGVGIIFYFIFCVVCIKYEIVGNSGIKKPG